VNKQYIRATVALLVIAAANVLPARAQSSSDLELAGLARNAEARHASYESQLAALDPQAQASEYARVADLRDRNARVLEGYRTRLGSSASAPAAPSNAPAAPESSGGMLSGLTSKVSGLFGGGSSGNPAGPEAQSWSGASGGGGGILDMLKQNWGSLAGGVAGSVAGGMLASRFAGGNKIAYIAGSLVGGWVGSKVGGWVQNKFFNKGGSSSTGGGQQQAQTQYGPSGYTQTAGGTVYNAPGVQINYPSGYGAQTIAPAPQAQSLAEARELMNGRYQTFLASQNNPAAQAQAYQQYMTQKSVYEQWVAQARAQHGAR
jgi:hypothetical protein